MVALIGIEPGPFTFELSFKWLFNELADIWQPFLLGCFVVGTTLAILSFILVRILWRLHIVTHIKERAQRLHNKRHKARDNL